MRADGTHVRDLTLNLAQDGQPAWSPDGTEIAFVSTRDGNAEIYAMHADGSDQRRLTHSPASNDTAPVWSPDGTRVAFMCTFGSPRIVTEICVIGGDGRGAHELTARTQGDNLYPQWSHDSQIVLGTRSFGGYSVWSLRADGRGESLLVARGAEAAYSPDGLQLASLARQGRAGRWALYVGRRRLSRGTLSVDSLAWSPKGDRIAFVAGGNVYVVGADGSDERRLTDGPGQSLSPVWSAGGKTIAFERTRGQTSGVYVVGAGGGEARDLTGGAGKNGGPAWQP
jgi:Tol biopolymer transport system component